MMRLQFTEEMSRNPICDLQKEAKFPSRKVMVHRSAKIPWKMESVSHGPPQLPLLSLVVS